ncbi:class F sortase [Streptomyces sp. NPDC048389]|uniref:class F sortase n=1 Tax=Streptomyces sp. NPDC048389 TaxID=3154622 RepID=UPI0034555E57
MENGHRPRAAERPAFPVPSFKVLACAAIAGILLIADAARDEHPPQPSSAQSRSVSALPAPRTAPAPTGIQALPQSDPVRMVIPAIGVNAPMTRLELDDTGALRPPPADEPGLAGWYGRGTAPGATGTAVTAGHVDTPMGPGVFYRLGALTKGDTVEIMREDGRTAVFAVDAVEVHDRNDFPDDKVYGDADRPELRVITCGGPYSPGTGYQGNVVVYASLSAVR